MQLRRPRMGDTRLSLSSWDLLCDKSTLYGIPTEVPKHPAETLALAIEQTVHALVQAFHFLHKVCFGGLLEVGRSDLGPEHNDSIDDDDVVDGGRAQKVSS